VKTSAVTPMDLVASVISIPPLARGADGRPCLSENRKLLAWLRSAGIHSFLYGGIANFFNMSVTEFPSVLDAIETFAGPEDWMIPSIGPDFGKAMDQVAILKGRDFPTAMLLPFAPVMPAGVATGLRRLAEAYGRPLMLFFQSADYLKPRDIAALLADGILCTVEFGVRPTASGQNPFLHELLDLVGDTSHIIDARGESSIHDTARFGLKGFTSGMSALAPHLSTAVLKAVVAGELGKAASLVQSFAAISDLRATYSFVSVLYDALRFADIADPGVVGPFYAPITDPVVLARIKKESIMLKCANLDYAAVAAPLADPIDLP
jgi:4-hydroxy-tetrahydrodipicolinate synthase